MRALANAFAGDKSIGVSTALAVSFSLALGLAYAWLVLGAAPLDPTNAGWMKGDPVEHYLEWLFAQQSDGWHFPFTWTDRLGHPMGTYFSLIDPAFVVLFGAVASLVPAGWQLFGLFFAANAGLQFYWGARLTGLLARGDRFTALAGGLLALLSPIMAQKAQGHFSGGCQWPIIAALYCLLRPSEGTAPWRWMLPLWGLVALSAVIHPYTGATILLIAAAATLRLLAERRLGWSGALAILAFGPAVLAAVLYSVGILSVGGGATAEGFQDYTFNLLALFNPMAYRAVLPWRFPAFPLQEFEGYAYLGLGVLGLLAASAARLGRARVPWRSARMAAVIALMAGCLVIALSTRITFGSHVLLEYRLPGALGFLANAFRAPARFIWPDYYLLIAVAAAGVARAWPGKAGHILLAAAVAVQFVDTAGVRDHVRRFQAEPSPDAALYADWEGDWPGRSPVWSELGRGNAHLVVLPAWQCSQSLTPGGARGWGIFGRVAASQGMTLNEYRASRYAADALAFHCRTLPEAVAHGRLDDRTAYVLSDALFLRAMAGGGGSRHSCARVDGMILCTAGGTTGDWRPVIAPLPLGSRLPTAVGGAGLPLLDGAWHAPEPDGIWSNGREASLVLPLPDVGPVDLTFELRPLLAPSRPSQDVRLMVDAAELCRWTLTGANWQEGRTCHIPAERMPPGGVLVVTLAVDEVTAPRQLGYPGDDRPLGVALRALTIRSPSSE